MLDFVASLIAPPRCAVCRRACSWEHCLCAACDQSLRRASSCADPGRTGLPPGLDAAWSVGSYDGPVRAMATALKFAGRLQVARRIAEAIAEASPPDLIDGALVPVPPSPRRLMRRGFDPAEEITVALSDLSGRALVPCLERDHGPRQVGRQRRQRIADPPQVRLAFAPPPKAVLVDDVRTTGATLAACAQALRGGGAERVVAVTFARAD